MGVFADLTQDEYRQHALGYSPELRADRLLRSAAPFPYEATVPPKEISWVKNGAVTEVGRGLGQAGLAGRPRTDQGGPGGAAKAAAALARPKRSAPSLPLHLVTSAIRPPVNPCR